MKNPYHGNCILNLVTRTLNPNPKPVNPKPQILNPKTLNPETKPEVPSPRIYGTLKGSLLW